MPKFMRHDLVWLKGNKLPYVVTRQPTIKSGYLMVAQCLSPLKSSLSRLTFSIPIALIVKHTKPILFSTVLNYELNQANLPNTYHGLILNLATTQSKQGMIKINLILHQLLNLKLKLRVFGSYSWQYFSKQQFIGPNSDLDLLLYINQQSQLNYLFNLLNQLEELIGRFLDGELVLANKYFVAWREWFNFNPNVLVKTNTDVFLMTKDELKRQC